MAAWIASAKREGKSVPEPKTAQSHSGRLLLRMPQTLHAELARIAERESVSLNQFITDVLSGALGWRAVGQKARAGGAVRQLDVDDETGQARVASSEDGSRFGHDAPRQRHPGRRGGNRRDRRADRLGDALAARK